MARDMDYIYTQITGIQQALIRCYDKGYENAKNDICITDDEKAEAYREGCEKAWQCAQEICGMTKEELKAIHLYTECEFDDDMDDYEYSCRVITHNKDYEEIVVKFEEVEKKNSPVYIGDEIHSDLTHTNAIVTAIDLWDKWHCVRFDGVIFKIDKEQQKYWEKTGKRYEQILDILDQMRGVKDK